MYALAQMCRCRHLLCGEVQYSLSTCFGGVTLGVSVLGISSSFFDKVSAKESSVFPCLEEKLHPVVMVPIFLPLGSRWGHVSTPVMKALREKAL